MVQLTSSRLVYRFVSCGQPHAITIASTVCLVAERLASVEMGFSATSSSIKLLPAAAARYGPLVGLTQTRMTVNGVVRILHRKGVHPFKNSNVHSCLSEERHALTHVLPDICSWKTVHEINC